MRWLFCRLITLFVVACGLITLVGCVQNPANVEYRDHSAYKGSRFVSNNNKSDILEADITNPIIDEKQNNNDTEYKEKETPEIIIKEPVAEEVLQLKESPKPDIVIEKDTSESVVVKKSGFIIPANGKVLLPFGKSGNKFNDGVLLELNDDQEIRASADGNIVYVGRELQEYGNVIIIEHANDVMTSYSQVKNIGIKVGERVRRAQVIGTAGKTKDNQARLLFSIRVSGRAVDPFQYISE